MTAASRGLNGLFHQHSLRLPSSIRAVLFSARPQYAQSRGTIRHIASTASRGYRYPSSSGARSFISTDPILSAVSRTRQPILLYKAPEDRRWLYKTYALASGCVGLGLWTLKFGNELPIDMPFFVTPTYNVVGLILLAIGFVAVRRPTNRIQSLEVVPTTIGGPLQLRIRAKPAPFLKEKVILAHIGEVTLSEKSMPMVTELKDLEEFRKQKVSEDLGDGFILVRGWELSARYIYKKWTMFFNRFKHVVLSFGIVRLNHADHKWKIDCTGYLLEDGKALDRIISEE
ncbi:hypothetical protein BS50DRAFT_632148 [Corynespora cassiicola Philippines]|uniref:Uncharacterized protein n=1 Tax=Corynespora cassiicola Philippines TaxID=1448308 RepID=A0A2T2NXT6_CORCC|nr:hypothetical protein BS50DRAFT_632148 [Corynespora cassiicola Philippines]